MQIAKIRISGILGIDDLEFEAGKFNEIIGPNGAGKTSVLEAIKSVLKGGEDATLLRKGAERGEIVLLIDDGTELRRRVTPASTSTTVERGGVNVPSPNRTIKALTDMQSVNPVEFLRARPKDRVNVLLESLPMTADPARLTEIVGYEVKADSGLHALQVIEQIRKNVFDDRTGTNRAVREKDSTINQLTATLPDGAITVPGGAVELLKQLDTVDSAKDVELDRISTKLNNLGRESSVKLEAISAAAEVRLEDLRSQIDSIKSATADQLTDEREAFSEITRKANIQRERVLAKHTAERETFSSQLARIQAASSLVAKHEQTRETIATMVSEADGLRADAARQTAAIEALDAYKAELLSDLPIPGLEVTDGEIVRDGVVFDRLNTAQQVDIAVEIAKLRAGDLGVACVDGIELLDSAHFEEFRQRALKSGLQLFVTRVSDEDFGIRVDD